MSRHLAYRPRHQQVRIYPQPLRHSHKEYLRQGWTYRRQREIFLKRMPGLGLVSIPWGWHPTRTSNQWRA